MKKKKIIISVIIVIFALVMVWILKDHKKISGYFNSGVYELETVRTDGRSRTTTAYCAGKKRFYGCRVGWNKGGKIQIMRNLVDKEKLWC